MIPEKAVVLRTGGLGDFVLTVPLLVSLTAGKGEVTVATRRSYYDLISCFFENLSFLEVDECLFSQSLNELDAIFHGATVYSFW